MNAKEIFVDRNIDENAKNVPDGHTISLVEVFRASLKTLPITMSVRAGGKVSSIAVSVDMRDGTHIVHVTDEVTVCVRSRVCL